MNQKVATKYDCLFSKFKLLPSKSIVSRVLSVLAGILSVLVSIYAKDDENLTLLYVLGTGAVFVLSLFIFEFYRLKILKKRIGPATVKSLHEFVSAFQIRFKRDVRVTVYSLAGKRSLRVLARNFIGDIKYIDKILPIDATFVKAAITKKDAVCIEVDKEIITSEYKNIKAKYFLNYKATVVVPIIYKGEVVGAIAIDSKTLLTTADLKRIVDFVKENVSVIRKEVEDAYKLEN